MKYHKHILSNNITILTIPMPQTEAVMMMGMICFGSRNEDNQHKGIAHFMEHMAFKGGKQFKDSQAFSTAIDSVGGEINAFTSEEVTAYHIKLAKEYIDLGLDVLADLIKNPRYPEEEIAKEKGVIVEEINMYEDMPRYKAALELGPLLYPDHPLGWSIAGEKKTVNSISRKDFQRFHQEYYTGANLTVVLAGAVSEKDISKVKERFSDLKQGQRSQVEGPGGGQQGAACRLIEKTSEQTHLVLGIRALNITDPRRFSYKILSTILGGNMSSRLFINIREKLGICYYIYADTQAYVDAGYFAVMGGVDNSRVTLALEGIVRELNSVKNSITEDEIEKAKRYMIGKIKLGLEDSEEIARFFITQQVLEKTILTPEEVMKEIQSVNKSEVLKLAQDIFQPENTNLSLVGPKQKEDKILSILSKI